MNDDWIERELEASLRPPRGQSTPAFDDTMRAAHERLVRRRRRLRTVGGVAAMAALVAVGIGVSLRDAAPPGVDLRIDEALLGSTQWRAPSDVLMPTHEFDIYRDTPALPGSTETL